MSAPDDPNDPFTLKPLAPGTPKKVVPLKDSTKAEFILKAASRRDHAPPGVVPIVPKPAGPGRRFQLRPATPGLTPGGTTSSSLNQPKREAAAAPKKTFAPLTQGGMQQRFSDAARTEAQKKAAEQKEAREKKEFAPLSKNFRLSSEFNKHKR